MNTKTKVQVRIRPVNNWVLIRKHAQAEKTTDAGVVIPEGQGRSSRGTVIGAAKDVPLFPGDEVIFTNFPIELEDLEELTGDKLLNLVRWEEIYAVVESDECT
jgi:co-chaperonin GroES (HSP10)